MCFEKQKEPKQKTLQMLVCINSHMSKNKYCLYFFLIALVFNPAKVTGKQTIKLEFKLSIFIKTYHK
ncbi:hypothetical protein BOQ64_17895 [Chryseobacterium sp. CH25]|nr:hypothetical protein BOQ64_17895 [Chryseobacterium sp. CH25]